MNSSEEMMSERVSTLEPALEAQLERLSAQRERWRALDPQARGAYLDLLLKRLREIDFDRLGEEAATHQGFDPQEAEGEVRAALEGLATALMMSSSLQALKRSYRAAQKGRAFAAGLPRRRQGAQEVVEVFPSCFADRMSAEGFAGLRGELWLQPGQQVDAAYPAPDEGALCLILGAGNQSFLSFGDVIYQLFVEGQVCLLKHHPLRAYCAPFFEQLFRDLIEEGFFAACCCDLQETQALIADPRVDRVHMTGGVETHDAIVWGASAEERAARKASGEPALPKPMSSELGCVTPWLISPGAEWTERELDEIIAHLSLAFTSQNSCNCLAPKLLVIDPDWPQAERFLEVLRGYLQRAPLPPPYYPGTATRYQGFLDHYREEEREQISGRDHPARADHALGETLPWLLLHLDQDSDRYALQTEAFAPILAIYRLPSENNAERFLRAAVRLANEEVWGSLSATLIAHPSAQQGERDPVEEAIAALRYGSVALNSWTASVYGLSGLSWGAYPGEPLDAVESGIGFVRNPYFLKGIEKSVLRAPFQSRGRLRLAPSGELPNSARQLRALAALFKAPSLRAVLRVIGSFLRRA